VLRRCRRHRRRCLVRQGREAAASAAIAAAEDVDDGVALLRGIASVSRAFPNGPLGRADGLQIA